MRMEGDAFSSVGAAEKGISLFAPLNTPSGPGGPAMSMSLEEQVALLMQGTEYGDEALRQAMEAELRERLREGRPLRV